jgi:hypothetical protein
LMPMLLFHGTFLIPMDLLLPSVYVPFMIHGGRGSLVVYISVQEGSW